MTERPQNSRISTSVQRLYLKIAKLLSLFLAFGILELSDTCYLIFKVLSLYLFYPEGSCDL